MVDVKRRIKTDSTDIVDVVALSLREKFINFHIDAGVPLGYNIGCQHDSCDGNMHTFDSSLNINHVIEQ
jgi:hypothetical protein